MVALEAASLILPKLTELLKTLSSTGLFLLCLIDGFLASLKARFKTLLTSRIFPKYLWSKTKKSW